MEVLNIGDKVVVVFDLYEIQNLVDSIKNDLYWSNQLSRCVKEAGFRLL